jgi:serine/threonine-protein kinase
VIRVGATLNERFTLQKELGEGGMGTVFRATDQVLGRSVAIKLLKDCGGEGVVERIRLEAQILARLVHDRIVRLYDFGESEGTYFLVMEEVSGSSFAERMRDLPLEDRLRVCGQVAEALAYAHLRGVIHRDVKPGNVLLTAGDEAKLSDFGLSIVNADGRDPSGAIRGTPRYMSPEQAQGRRIDHRTDLYSVGVMLYECATGVVPFASQGISVLNQHVNEKPEAPRFKNPMISPTLEILILSLLEKSPGRRPTSGHVVAGALLEEAERARRLERVNPGRRRLDPGRPDDPHSPTLTLDHVRVGTAASHGPGWVSSGADARPGGESSPVAASPRSEAQAPPAGGSFRRSRTGHPYAPGSYSHPVARLMLTETLAVPITLTPEERYLCGHYLAYLLGGSRRQGIFLRRPFDARNEDRARLLLAMSWLWCVGPSHEAIERASVLLDERPDVRVALSPVVVMKYLANRDTPAKRQRFREVRQRLQEASAYARQSMLNPKGVLNPGLMPRTLDDLTLIAPPRRSVDAHRVALWNRVAEVWRRDEDFRDAVLRYATRSAHLDEASIDLWPEVVYPLIERAHWQRTFRHRFEAIWDFVVGKLLHVPVTGVRLDRMMVVAIPVEVAEQFDEDLLAFVDEPRLDDFEAGVSASATIPKSRPFYFGATIPRDDPPSDDVPVVKVMIPLASPEPLLFTQAGLRELAERATSERRTVPVGPYWLAVVPTSRAVSRSAVVAILQGRNLGKEIEILTPAVCGRAAASRSVIAIWLYRDESVLVVHLDFQSRTRYILWHAPNAHQFNFEYLAELKHVLSSVYMQVPEQLEQSLPACG